jgi:lipoprotein-anchoring transpeptidase ErfK/SrfK
VNRFRLFAVFALLALVIVPLAGAQETPPPGSTEAPPPSTDPGPSEPGPDPGLLIPDGVTIESVPVGGLTVEQARGVVAAMFNQRLELVHGRMSWLVTPQRLGATAHIDGALSRALAAPPGSDVDLVVSVRGQDTRNFVAKLDRKIARAPKDARLKLFRLKPRIVPDRWGLKVDRNATVAAIVRALRSHERGPLRVEVTAVKPKVTEASLRGPVVVIRRETKKLYLYRGEKLWRTFGVATGQPSYPTPIGNFEIVVMQRNPWWYPPTSDWAKDAEPIPPGPGNPLGTRWMGLSAPLVGIHGTPDPASIGYSASHGCIRMRIPEAEWVFDHVKVGTPVFIVRA